jgi:sec-independent protein translocase protein TatA
MGEFSLTHLLLVGIIFLIFFGPSRLPQLGQSLGKAIRGFKEGLNEINAESKDVTQAREAQRLQQIAENKTSSASQQFSNDANSQEAKANKKDQV